MKVAIVGAGFSGIETAHRLKAEGHDFTLFERSGDVGGVWHDNTYPGAACDVPSYLYSFSWAQRRDWSRPCSPQEEIQRYLRGVAEQDGLLPHIRFGVEIAAARWDEQALQWTLTTGDGETHAFDALVLACGQLNRPAYPQIDGADAFAGTAFHSARWDHDADLRGKRVAVIGTGASAIQFVPAIVDQVGHLDVYQRTAPYLLPRRNPRYPGAAKNAIRFIPGLQTLRRYGMWGVMETFILGYTKLPPLKAAFRLWSAGFMRLQLRGDRALRKKVWPTHTFGCKRILFSSTYLPALRRRNVEVVSDRIERITADGVVTADGRERKVDAIVWGTGFVADEPVVPMQVHGAGGHELQERWGEGARAHLGITVAGFPNLFLMYGPNTNLGVGSIIVMIEAQAGYVLSALRLLRERGKQALTVRPEVEQVSTDAVQARLDDSVWTECQSWYRKDGTGRVVGNWPGFMVEYVRSVEHVNAGEYELLEAGAVPASEPAATA
ncbi:NAD(P)/FAD-dependent oxidoreductase [Conexibacter sp. JD483]|uniref:flavin-containing monooxygenase n=1 Tax=unclassified Conexibacter TaxID=2627773 RepID=UPI002728D3B6|nr:MULTISPECIES: NAD(P)/FAD-dependent oxidoreductase [unclassified Conexibacter]MDO8189089.1 NAD(P)/FAD-dependent oxidoreductase [Conexibacter sp. CPCC 205706]MDO8201864.1 NAD(P)/FAD-dependent oxidoreductase [Conexibacter sp. CPCC 205762]MDR9372781.1 NAD(P)/FAD-dependent oxidoreductase [Conexibacter sp. JD483]